MEASVYEELDEVKTQLELVREEYRKKILLHKELKRAYDDRMTEFQNAKFQIEKLSEEVCLKSAEVTEVQQICEELKNTIADKDLILQKSRSAYEKLQAGFKEKVMLLEGSNRELVMALDDVMGKNKMLEDKLCARNEENEGLKASLLATENKCFEMEKNVCMSKELTGREEMISRLEEELRNVEDRFKWRNEQFDHLEEAHDKLRGEFRLSRSEWEKERHEMIEQISSLQSSLDSQTRISSSLQTELNTCNQALAREESMRKLFQVQLTESSEHFKNVNCKCQEEYVKFDELTTQKDEEIANLRGQIASKDIMLNEKDFRIIELEQQKEDMHESLRELQEAEIKHASSISSMKMIQKKLRNLEVMHHKFSVNIDNKEAEWASHCERLKAEAKEYISEIGNKEAHVNDLQNELEMCQFSMQILNEEMEVVVMVLKSGYSEAYSMLSFEYESKKHEESAPALESKSSEHVEQHQSLLLKNDPEFHKNITEESHGKQTQLEEHIFEIKQSNEAELQMSQFSLQLFNEEMSVVIMVLKSGYSEAYSKLLNEYDNMKYEESSVPVLDSNVTDLVKQHQILLLTRNLEFELLKNIVNESHGKQTQLEEHIFEIKQSNEAELQMSQFSLQLLNDEMSVVIMVLKSGYSEAYSKLLNEYDNMKYEESPFPVLDSAVTDLVEQHQIHMLTRNLEFDLLKNMIKESHEKQRRLEEHIFEVEQAYKAVLIEETYERHLINAELLEWKNEAEIQKSSLEEARQTSQQLKSLLDLQLENHGASEKEINNLKKAIKELERNIAAFQQHVTSLEAVMAFKDDTLKLLDSKNKHYDGIIRELEFKNMHLNENLASLVTHRNNILLEMEGACNQLHEIFSNDESLLGSFGNTECPQGDYISNSSRRNKTLVKHC